ncbi:cobyric acid synthase [Neokomagataea thailandica]|nr:MULTISPECIES: cobyric acid synthase [Neokomagataea]
MFQGTGSSVGKSVFVAGLARALVRRGLRVRPFKPQNMSNNAAVTADGGEIGRAQALQAQACGVMPSVDMNPVLLKPQSMVGSQLVVCGQARGNVKARTYQDVKKTLLPDVLGAFERLSLDADIVLIEGAGSASEVNLRENDIANMGFAEASGAPVVLIGDIDRGGVIASLVGTKVVLPKPDAERIKGFIVNRMRGDPSLFDEGMRVIAERTGWKALGLLPYSEHVRHFPAEDAADVLEHQRSGGVGLHIVVPYLPMIANFDDLDPLKAMDGVRLEMLPPGRPLPVCDLVLLPGSKATITDLEIFREQGWDVDLKAHVRRGGYVFGICGGYQMLGTSLSDPLGVEGEEKTVEGLGLLRVQTALTGQKILREVRGVLAENNVPVVGYEMHMGVTDGPDCARPFVRLDTHDDGAMDVTGRVWGTYLHGVFEHGALCQALLARLGARDFSVVDHAERVEAALNAWAEHIERHVDVEALLRLARPIETHDRSASISA